MKKESYLLLKDQLCFPIYAVSRLITRSYQPMLDALDLTYPQYLVLLALWEEDNVNVGRLGQRLFLNTNTLTPLLKKLKEKGVITKTRSNRDERSVFIKLTLKGISLKNKAEAVPLKLLESLKMPKDDLLLMRKLMWQFLDSFEEE